MSDRKDVKLYALAKVCLNTNESLKCVRYLTKALLFNQHIDYYLQRSRTYLSIGSESSLNQNALQMALRDCLTAKHINSSDRRVIDLFKRLQLLLPQMEGQTDCQTNNWLLLVQELTEKIANEKNGKGCQSVLLDYYIERYVCYETIGTKEAKQLAQNDCEKCKKNFKEFSADSVKDRFKNARIKYKKVVEKTSNEQSVNPFNDSIAVTKDYDNNQRVSEEVVSTIHDLSDDEIYYSDADFD